MNDSMLDILAATAADEAARLAGKDGSYTRTASIAWQQTLDKWLAEKDPRLGEFQGVDLTTPPVAFVHHYLFVLHALMS